MLQPNHDIDISVCPITPRLLEEISEFEMRGDRMMPKEWIMSSEEKDIILGTDSFAVVGRRDRILILSSIVIPSGAAKEIVGNDDPLFHSGSFKAYSFSECVRAESQGTGLGRVLLEHTAKEAKNRGYRFLVAHVRMRRGWYVGRRKILTIVSEHVAPNFWAHVSEMDSEERPMMYQIARL